MRALLLKNSFIIYKYLLTVCLLLSFASLYAQSGKVDSLDNLLRAHPQQDDRRATLLFEVAQQTIFKDPKKALAHLDQIISIKDKIKARNIVSSTYRVKGITHYLLSQYPEALAAMNEALRLDRLLKVNTGIAGDLSSIGMVYLAQSNFSRSLSNYLLAARMYESIVGQEKDAVSTYANIGVIYLQINNFTKATEHFEIALEKARKLKYYPPQITALSNLGIIADRQNNHGKALKYSQMSLRLADSVGEKTSVARETGNLSGYYSAVGKYDLAILYAARAIELNKAIGNKRSIGYNTQNLSSAYMKKGELTAAKNYGLAAYRIGNELKISDIIQDAAAGLSEIYQKKGMPDSALFYFQKSTKLKDSINSDQKKQEITRMTIQYDFDKKENDYKQEQLLSNEKLKQEHLKLALNGQKLQTSMQEQALQKIQLQNEKLQTEEKQKQLQISVNSEKLQKGKVRALYQQQQLEKLKSRQLWLFTILLAVIVLSVLLLLLNQYRIRQLRLKNTLQQQEAEQQAREISYRNKLSESELKAIRSQMNPHFIFNVLNSIESYVLENDSKTASRLVQKFATLSRLILENSTQSMVVAEREWKALKLYTELEAMRFNNQFSYLFYADPDLDLATLMLPPMLVQPLIENSIHHGLRNSSEDKSSVNVRLEQTADEILFTVDDTGIGMDEAEKFKTPSAIKSKSIGLNAIRERVEIINMMNKGNKAGFEIRRKNAGEGPGTIAVLTLPKIIRKAGPANG